MISVMKQEFMRCSDMIKYDRKQKKTLYKIEDFYDHLSENGWKINGAQIESRNDWERALIAKLDSFDSSVGHLYYWAFCHLFSTYNGCRDEEGRTSAEAIAYRYMDSFDENKNNWKIGGKVYPFSEKQAALDAFAAEWLEEQEESRPPYRMEWNLVYRIKSK